MVARDAAPGARVAGEGERSRGSGPKGRSGSQPGDPSIRGLDGGWCLRALSMVMGDQGVGERRTLRRSRVAKAVLVPVLLVGSVSVPLASFDARFLLVSCLCLAVVLLLDPIAFPGRTEPWWHGPSKWAGSLDVASGAGRLVTAIRRTERSVRAQFQHSADRRRRRR